MNFVNLKHIFLFYFWIINCLHICDSFNVDIRFPVIYPGPNGSYFGFSVAFHRNTEGIWLLVGAPRANQTFHSQIHQPGNLYKCHISGTTCSEVELDPTGNEYGVLFLNQYHDKKDNGWLGGSLDVSHDGQVLTCAHRWKNQFHYLNSIQTHQRDIFDYFSNGICYTISKELRLDTAKRHIPLIATAAQVRDHGVPYFAFGMAGMSAHFAMDKNILLGAPGVYSWTGKLVTIKNSALEQEFPSIWGPEEYNRKNNFMYLGYSVSSGRFSSTSPEISFVIGAPRQNYRGKVFIVRMTQLKSTVQFEFAGTQLGEYFGAAVCAVDLNNDGVEDLLVGSPLYADEIDEGKVYVFLKNNSKNFNQEPIELRGSNVRLARFGTAITSIGDINMDGLKDFAVGAPFENDNGAVYIYHGHQTDGIAKELTQRIEGKNIDPNLRGFGISIARGFDVDKNNYLDIAVGSYESGNAVVLRSLPVVSLEAWIITDPSKIAMSNPKCVLNSQPIRCCNLTICMKYLSHTNQAAFDVSMQLQIDPSIKLEYPRGFVMVGNEKNSTVFATSRLNDRHSQCQEIKLYFRDDIKNYLSPIDIVFDLSLAKTPTDEFCSRCPVLDPRSQKSISHQVWFLNGCKNELCISDLQLNVTVVDETGNRLDNPKIWLGENSSVILDISVRNSGDDAFLSEMNVSIPIWSRFVKYPSWCNDQSATNDRRFFTCDIGNPIPANSMISMNLILDIELVHWEAEVLKIDFSVNTGSEEHEENLHDNKVTIEIPMSLTADLAVFGSTPTEYISYDHGSKESSVLLTFSHVYEVTNFGPSPLSAVQVTLRVPEQTLDGSLTFVNITQVKTKDGHKTARVGECRGADTTYLTNEGKPRDRLEGPEPVKRRKRSLSNKKNKHDGPILFCDKARCAQIKCDIFSLSPADGVFITLDLEVNSMLLDKLDMKSDIIEFATEAAGVILNVPSNIQPSIHRPDSATVVTSLDSGKTSPQELPDWVIPVAVILGILLLILLIFGLYKFGFFNREKQVEMRNMKNEGSNRGSEQTSSVIFSSQNNLLDEEITGADNQSTDT